MQLLRQTGNIDKNKEVIQGEIQIGLFGSVDKRS